MRLSEMLLRQAEELNACKRGLVNFPDTKQGLIDRWKANIDFAVENDFPTIEVMKKGFDRSLLHENLIYVDEDIMLEDALSGVYVINGNCRGTLRFRDWNVATIYLRHNSEINIIAEGESKVFVKQYDGSTVAVCELEEALVRVYDRR